MLEWNRETGEFDVLTTEQEALAIKLRQSVNNTLTQPLVNLSEKSQPRIFVSGEDTPGDIFPFGPTASGYVDTVINTQRAGRYIKYRWDED